MNNLCSWCQAANWQYRCSTCDPRKEKVLCCNCSILWHSRGAARNHLLTSNHGETRSFSAWTASKQNNVNHSNGSSEKKAVDTTNESDNVDTGVQQTQRIEMNGTEDTSTSAASREQKKPKEEDIKAAEEKKRSLEASMQDDEEKDGELMDKEAEIEAVCESQDIGNDGDAASVEKKAKNASSEEKVASAGSISESDSSVKSSGRRAEGQGESNGREHKDNSFSPAPSAQAVPPTPPSAATNTSVQDQDTTLVTADDPAARLLEPTCPADSLSNGTALTSASSSIPVPQSEPVDLDNLLQCFPTTNQMLLEMLSARVEEVLVMEDALICARFGKCQEPLCRSVMLHYEHCKRNETCCDPKCAEILAVYRHRRACSKKNRTLTSDYKKSVCPFCVRIQQRRSLGVSRALDYLISDQRRALQGAQSAANRNFCLQSINSWSQRKQVLLAETDRLNELASKSSMPIFNFPRYQWHFGDPLFIKREPTPLEIESNTEEWPTALGIVDGKNESAIAELPYSSHSGDRHNFVSDNEASAQHNEDHQEDSMLKDASSDVDMINNLLRAKTENGDGKTAASQREFDRVMELGYNIVDASFCTPSKAQWCLLNCKSVLLHLQHHLDLQVCTQAMCTAVGHHFAHLSQCKAYDENGACEYCLRVEERQLIRSVNSMEAEQPETEARVQTIINDITTSYTKHRSDEQEQEGIQLEEELERAEVNKQELLKKLSAARIGLRNVQRSMERHGISPSIGSQLPVHFTKGRYAEESSSDSKRRRLLGSLE